MAKWQAIVGETVYELSNREPFDVVSVTGVGIAPMRRLTQRGPLQHGETDVGFRLDPRAVNLVLAIKAANRAAADTARLTLAYIFGPRQSQPVKLRCIRDDNVVRQIDVRAVGIVDTPITQEERVGEFQRVGLQLVASDPNWYDPTNVTVLGSVAPGSWFVPREIPFIIQSVTNLDEIIELPYVGTFDEYPTITLRGPMEDPIITNLTTGDVLDLTGTILGSGDTYVIDLRYGYKTVTEDDGTNRIAALSANSDLATWRLASILETANGKNVIQFNVTDMTVASRLDISYVNRFVSL